MQIEVGAQVPSFEVTDGHGDLWRIPQVLEAGKPLLLVFLRHLGCPLCRQRVDELKEEHALFVEAGVELLVITQSSAKRVAKFASKQSIPYGIVGDREKRLYDLFGVKRGGLGQYATGRVVAKTVRAATKGYLHGRFEGDEFQMPAELIVAPDGRIAWSHYGTDVADASPNEVLLDALGQIGFPPGVLADSAAT